MASNDPNDPDYDPSLMAQAAEQQARDNADPLATTPAPAPPPPAASPAPPPPTYTATPETAPSYDATLGTYDESKGVAGRVNSITSEDSPLMLQAATKGTQTAAARGLTNSSLAAEASQNAVLSAATPIATADASLYAQQQLANQQALNTAGMTNAQLQSETAKLNAQKEQFAASLGLSVQDLDLKRDSLNESQRQALDQINMQMKTLAANQSNFQAELTQRDQQFQATQQQQLVMQGLDNDAKTQLANIEAQYKLDIQNNTNVSQAWGTMMTNIAQIQNNKDLNADTKTTLINNTLSSFAAYAEFWKKAAGPDAPPVDDLLNFGPPGSTTAPGAQAPVPPPPPPNLGGVPDYGTPPNTGNGGGGP